MSHYNSDEREQPRYKKLYRLLGDHESIENGLTAKDPYSTTSVAKHVAYGSNFGIQSKYISTCTHFHAALKFRSLKLRSGYCYGKKDIVEINVSKLPDKVKIIDLTSSECRWKYEDQSDNAINYRFHRFAVDHSEVLLVGFIPPRCLKLIPFPSCELPDSDSDSEDLITVETVRDSVPDSYKNSEDLLTSEIVRDSVAITSVRYSDSDSDSESGLLACLKSCVIL